MKAHVLKGSKQEIAEGVARMNGEVREAIVFVEEPSEKKLQAAEGNMFAEMESHTVNVKDADDSRESIYRRTDGE